MPFVALGFANRGPDAARSTRHFGMGIAAKQQRKDDLGLRSRIFLRHSPYCSTTEHRKQSRSTSYRIKPTVSPPTPLDFTRPRSLITANEDAFFAV